MRRTTVTREHRFENPFISRQTVDNMEYQLIRNQLSHCFHITHNREKLNHVQRISQKSKGQKKAFNHCLCSHKSLKSVYTVYCDVKSNKPIKIYRYHEERKP